MPNTTQVIRGAFVSIVLKIDQPTGREVQGTVADVLTSGNHPHGIKVCLVDGRVGRVQRIVSEEVAKAGAEGLSNLGRNGEESSLAQPTSWPAHRYRNVREEEATNLPPSGYSLEAFLPQGHPLNRREVAAPPVVVPEMHVCPVCGEFEGDEAAVSHHVAEHFD